MKIESLVVTHGWVVVGLVLISLLSISNSFNLGGDLEPINGHSVTYNYDRIDEVRKECAFVLDSANELKPDDSRLFRIKELSFINGDWWQDLNGAPLMPFEDRDVSGNSSDLQTPLKLASFWVTDVGRVDPSRKWISVSGDMQMGMTLDGTFVEKQYFGDRRFNLWPGHSELQVSFQGIYTESKDNGNERVMCLLGSTLLPSRDPDSNDPWDWVKNSEYTNQPPLLQDDQIMLVLYYPKTMALTNRVIRGRMESLNLKTNLKYFDDVHFSSSLGAYAQYEFGHEHIVSKACDPYPYKDSFWSGGVDIYKGMDFCSIVERFTREKAMTIVPNWKCKGTDEYCSKLGPFVSNKEIKATDGGFEDVNLFMQDVRCEKESSKADTALTKVAAVFRAVPPSESRFSAAQRTGLNNMTLSAEGIWKSSTGQLCMVGCRGLVDAEGNGCDSRICLYIPTFFSIEQQSVITGTISNIDEKTKLYFPLSFESLVRPVELWNLATAPHAHYKYSKIESAGAILEKNKPFNFGTLFKRSLLKFPKLEDTETYLFSLSSLSEDLTLHVPAVPDPIPKSLPQRTDLQMELFSLGPLFGRYIAYENGSSSTTEEETPYQPKAESSEKQLLLNVSAQLRLSGNSYKNFSVLSVEGLYDPLNGNMYLIGCRDVRASWKILFESMDLEAGLDCLIEVVISYPPTTSRWLVNPTAKISIASQRTEDDPLYFSLIKLQTLPIMYRKQREDILSRRGVEGILRVLTLSMAIAFILSQLLYIRDNLDSVPYMSLVMLGVQALGYSLPLITGAEALFKRTNSESYNQGPSYDLDQSRWIHVIDYIVKLLVLVAFSLTLRLFQKVWKSRIRLLTRAPLEPHRVPSDKRVLLTTLAIHVIGYIAILILHSVKTSRRTIQTETYATSEGNSQTLHEWETELEEYVGLVQDFFLLPQIIGNLMWQIHCKPLRKLYFIGITVVRLLPHIYDYIRSPVPNPYFSEEYEFVNPSLDFYSKFGDIAIPLTAVLLAVIVYVQQRWEYEILSRNLTLGKYKILPLGSRVYERLPSKSFEAELASGVNSSHEKEHEEEGGL